jgi:multisubunit Na+/H+ antiporter MnhB subunit
MEGERRRWGRWLVVALWIAGLVVWSFVPLSDNVPTGLVDEKATFREFECSAPIDGEARPVSFILPELAPPRSYTRPPCDQVHTVNRRMLVANAVLVALAIGALVWFERRRSRVTDSSPDAVAA